MKNLALETGQNRLLLLSEPIGRVSVADPKIADLKVITPTQLLLTSRGVGSHRPDAVEQAGRGAGHRAAGRRATSIALRSQLLEFFPDREDLGVGRPAI